ncbi:hypothetical protein RBB50_012477 [Rhinocladiella similis]
MSSTGTRVENVVTEASHLSLPPSPVSVFDAASVTSDQVVKALVNDGGCVIKNILSPSDLAAIEKNTRPYIDADKAWDGEFFPRETRRVMGLAGKSSVYMQHIVFNQIYQDVCEKILSSSYGCWVGKEWKQSISKPQLNNAAVLSIGPGARDQELHRDSMIHHLRTKACDPSTFDLNQETGIGFFVAGKRATKANGATRFIPGSHLWDHNVPPNEDLVYYAELEAGDGFMMLASAYHGGSANTTTKEERLIYSAFMTKGYLRQEENQYLANGWDVVRDKYDDKALELIGYGLSPPFLGWIDAMHPLQYLRGTAEFKDLF